jgi:YaiO family outer membrane protein
LRAFWSLAILAVCFAVAAVPTAWASATDDGAPAPVNVQADGARGDEPPSGSLQFGAAYEHLSNDLGPWRSAHLAVRVGNPAQSVFASMQESVRFSLQDYDVTAGLERRVTPRVVGAAEFFVSPSHRVSPKWGVLGRVQVDAGHGWVVHASLDHRRYASATVDIGSSAIERYMGRFRAAYSLYASRLHGSRIAFAHRVQGDVYYGPPGSSVGLSLASGEEIENVQPLGLLSTRVLSAAVVGRQAVSAGWVLTYDVVVHRQGSLYTRHRSSIGLGRRF